MARIYHELKVSVHLPWWWRAALYAYSVYCLARIYLGLPFNEALESQRFGKFIAKRTKFRLL